MTAPWFAPEGAYLFSLAGLLCFTTLAAPLITRGERRRLVWGLWIAIIATGAAMFVLGLVAQWRGQPAHVRLPLLATGAAMSLGYAVSLIFVRRVYRLAEARKVAAHEL